VDDLASGHVDADSSFQADVAEGQYGRGVSPAGTANVEPTSSRTQAGALWAIGIVTMRYEGFNDNPLVFTARAVR
jgi:hypothetical protein